MKSLTITSNQANQRLDKFLAKYLRNAQKSFLYKMLRKKNITLNGRKCEGSELLQEGDLVTLFFSEETLARFCGEEEEYPCHPLSILYEDEDILLVNKPVGMLSQKAESNDVSLNEYLIGYLLKEGKLSQQELTAFKPSVCNRLDRNTSGIVICGKSLRGLQEMARVLKDRSVKKEYLCLISGVVKEAGISRGYLCKDEKSNRVWITEKKEEGAKAIETEFWPLCDNGRVTLLLVHLITGRSHQIRAQFANLGHPLVGDFKYGDRRLCEEFRRKYRLENQLLHAYRITFPKGSARLRALEGHSFTAPPPEKLQSILRAEGLWLP